MNFINFYIISIYCIFSSQLIAQSYSTYITNDGQLRIVHISIDLDFSPSGIYVSKEFSTLTQGSVIDSNNVVLMGEYEFVGDSSKLDLNLYNYYLIPFDPQEPFYSLDDLLSSGLPSAYLYVAPPTTFVGDRDLVYMCNCGHFQSNDPTGCGAMIDYETSIISCNRINQECSDYCRGFWHLEKAETVINKGGIIIQVDSSKTQFYHDLQTAN